MKKIRVAIIGCGTIANSAHIPAYTKHPEVEIRYFCDIIPERAEQAAAKYGSGKVVQDYRSLLDADDVDAVSICTPNHVHAQIAIDFLNAKKDVLCEKPAARTFAEAKEMLRVFEQSQQVLNIGVCNRFNSSVMRIRELIQAGELGEVFHVYISFRSHRSIPGLGGAFTQKAIAGGGALIDWGVHFIDLTMYCCGDPAPLSVSGEAFSRLGVNMPQYAYTDMWAGPPDYDGVYDVDDSVTALIRTAGPTITLHGAWAQNIGQNEMYVDFMGDKGGIRLEYGKDFTIYSSKNGDLITTKPAFHMENMYEVEIDSFIQCIKNRSRHEKGSIEYAVLTSQIMQAIYDSSASHREITFEEAAK